MRKTRVESRKGYKTASHTKTILVGSVLLTVATLWVAHRAIVSYVYKHIDESRLLISEQVGLSVLSLSAGIDGFRITTLISIVGIDLDEDLDVFVANAMDGDYFPLGAKGWAGAANQLVETGKLRFIERTLTLSKEQDIVS